MIIMELLLMFIAVIGVAIIFNVPKTEVVYCGFVGLISWIFYLIVISFGGSFITATIVGVIFGTYSSKELTYIRKMPLTTYVLAAILPLAPGYYIYSAMYSSVMDEVQTMHYLLDAFKIAGSIGIGMSIGLVVPSIVRKLKGMDYNGQING